MEGIFPESQVFHEFVLKDSEKIRKTWFILKILVIQAHFNYHIDLQT